MDDQVPSSPLIEWERLADSSLGGKFFGKDVHYATFRLKVPGGWLILLWIGGTALSPTFVPDQEHKWDSKPLS